MIIYTDISRLDSKHNSRYIYKIVKIRICDTWYKKMTKSADWIRGASELMDSISVCCSVLQCVAVCCSVLQCVAVC